MIKYLVISLILLAATLAATESNYFHPNLQLGSMLNPNKLSIGHSISFSSGISSNRTSSYESKYTNHLNYKFSEKLNLKIDLSVVNFGMTSFKKDFSIEANSNNTTHIVPEFRLDFSPTENSKITIEFKQGYSNSLYPISYYPSYWDK